MTRRTTYLAGLLGKVRGEATNSSHVDDKNEDDEDHDDIAWSEEQDESDDDDCSVSVLPKPGEASLSDIEDYGPYWNNSSVHTIPGSSFKLNFEYLRFSWFILLGFLFFSSCFSLIVSFVFKPPDIKIFCLLPTGNRQENAPKKLTTTSLSFGDSVHVQMFLSVLFTDDFLSCSVFKIVRTLH